MICERCGKTTNVSTICSCLGGFKFNLCNSCNNELVCFTEESEEYYELCLSTALVDASTKALEDHIKHIAHSHGIKMNHYEKDWKDKFQSFLRAKKKLFEMTVRFIKNETLGNN